MGRAWARHVVAGLLLLGVWALSMATLAQNPASSEAINPLNPFALKATEPVDGWMALGPFLLNESDQTTPALPTELLTEKGAFRPDTFFWREGEPYTWFPAVTGSDRHLYLRQAVAQSRFRPRSEGPQAFYLYRAIQVPERAVRVLALSVPGETRVWLNGQSVEPGQTSATTSTTANPVFWSPPGADSYLAVVQLQKGINHLLIQSKAPPQGALWRIQARLVGRGVFNRGEVVYPRWQFSTSPPWTTDGPPLQARWGDPIIEAYLKQTTRPIGVQIALASDISTTPGNMQSAVGQAFTLTLPDLARAAALTLSANLLSTTVTTATSDTAPLSPLAETAHTILIGDAEKISVVMQARLLVETSRVAEPVRARMRAMLTLLDAAVGTDAHPVGLDRILEGLLFLTARIKAPKTIPESGWALFDASAKDRTLPYALWIPRAESSVPTSHPLLIALPSAEASAFDLIERQPALFQEAQRHQWLVAVPTQEPEGKWDWSKREETIEAIRRDIGAHFKLDPRLVCLLGFESAGEFAITYALSHRDAVAGVATLNVLWVPGTPWRRLLENTVPRPILFVAASLPFGENLTVAESFAPDPIVAALRNAYLKDGSWKRFVVDQKNPRNFYDTMFLHFEKRPLPSSPSRITLRLPDIGSTSAGWVRLRKALQEDLAATLSIASVTTNSIEVEVQNVARFDLTFRNIPQLDPKRPVLLSIREKNEDEQSPEVQKLRILEPSKPDLIVIEQSSSTLNQNQLRWAARTAMAADKTSDSLARTLAEMEETASPIAAGGLIAHALRLQSNAEVSLLPALQVRSGFEKGALTVNQISSVLPDSNLARMSLPRQALARMLEHDYAGPRSLLTDGLAATIGNTEEETTPTEALAAASPTSVSTTAWQSTPAGKAWLVSPVFNQTLENVTVVGTRSALTTARIQCGLPSEGSLIEDLSLGTHEAALRFFYQFKRVPPPQPDIRLPSPSAATIKRAIEYKTFRSKKSDTNGEEAEAEPSGARTRSSNQETAPVEPSAPENSGEAQETTGTVQTSEISGKSPEDPEIPAAKAPDEEEEPQQDTPARKASASSRKVTKYRFSKTPEKESGKAAVEESEAAETEPAVETPKAGQDPQTPAEGDAKPVAKPAEAGPDPKSETPTDKTAPITKRKSRLKVQLSE